MAASAYRLYQRRYWIDTIEFLDTRVCINDSDWESSEIIMFLCNYYIVTSDTLEGFF